VFSYDGYEDILVEKQDGVVLATLNVPDKLNAMTIGMRQGIKRLIDEIGSDDEARVLVLTGAGRAFCAGADVSSSAGSAYVKDGTRPNITEPRYRWVSDFVSLDKPTIACVNGVAAGGGLALALMCDIRIASEKARFISVFVRRALTPDNGTSWLLPRLIGKSQALKMILTGDEVDAQEAYRIGLVDEIAPEDEALENALTLAKRIASNPPVTVELSKRAVLKGLESDIVRQAEYEEYIQRIVRDTEDFVEANLARQENRSPKYKGI
tara:strand:- start:196 stop:996 length:801 start_codon:yes stop_codon:yes gene_type:complete